MKKFLSLAVSSLMLASALVGCAAPAAAPAAAATAEAAAPSADPIKIAVAAPMTGDNAEYGQGFYNAATLMADEWNANGGVLGRQIEIVQYDDKSSNDEAVSIAEQIVSDKDVVGVIGHFASGVCMVAAPIYQENNLVEISPSASHADYSSIGDCIFRNNTVISVEGAVGLDIAVNDLGKKNIGLVSIKTDWGEGTANTIKDLVAARNDGSKIVAHEEVMTEIDDFSVPISNLMDAGADVIICAGMYGTLAPLAVQYKARQPEIAMVGFSNAYTENLISLAGEAAEGIRCPVILFAGSEDPTISAYVKKYNEKFGSDPSALTSQAYDSVGILLTAVKNAGSTDKDSVKKAMYEVKYPGVTGMTTFNEIGDADKTFTKIMVQDGKFVECK